MVSYYLDTTTDPTLPRLVRQVNDGARLAIALGVENLQLTYDLVDGVTNPTNVETPVAPEQPESDPQGQPVPGGAVARHQTCRRNQYLRNSMATEVGLRSLSFVDRYQ